MPCLATSLAAFANAGMLLYMLIRYKSLSHVGECVIFVKLFVANAAMAMMHIIYQGKQPLGLIGCTDAVIYLVLYVLQCAYMLMLFVPIRLTDFKSPWSMQLIRYIDSFFFRLMAVCWHR